MWLKRNEEMYNLELFEGIGLQADGPEHYILLRRANGSGSSRLGPFGKGESQVYLENIAHAVKTGEKLWEFPENAEDLTIPNK